MSETLCITCLDCRYWKHQKWLHKDWGDCEKIPDSNQISVGPSSEDTITTYKSFGCLVGKEKRND